MAPRTLGIDIGGTGIKGAVIASNGTLESHRQKTRTPYPLPPEGPGGLLEVVGEFTQRFEAVDRVAVGFPGVVRRGTIMVAPHFESPDGLGGRVQHALAAQWRGYPLEARLTDCLGCPVKVVNDAELQGWSLIRGRGLEVVVTLGTGVGCAVYDEGRATPHLQFGSMPSGEEVDFDAYLGNRAFHKVGYDEWNRRLFLGVRALHDLVHFDHLYLTGGDARQVHRDVLGTLLAKVTVVTGGGAIAGGHYLFEPFVTNEG